VSTEGASTGFASREIERWVKVQVYLRLSCLLCVCCLHQIYSFTKRSVFLLSISYISIIYAKVLAGSTRADDSLVIQKCV